MQSSLYGSVIWRLFFSARSVTQQNGQYRMEFLASHDAAVTIDVHIRISDNVTGIYYHDAGDEASEASSQARYEKLRERLTLEFGADNITEGHSFFSPPDGKTSVGGNMSAAEPAILGHMAGTH